MTETPTQPHELCNEIITLREKVSKLEEWQTTTSAEIKEIRDVVSQVKLLMSMSIGGGALALINLFILLIKLI